MNRRVWMGYLLALAWATSAAADVASISARAQSARQFYTQFDPFSSGGLRTSVGALEPSLRKWYVPQELYTQYGWDQWQYTNYARQHYERYTDIVLEGTRRYDIYGDYIARGWEVYRWEEDQPRDLASSILKDPKYSSWFSSLIISAASKGQFQYALTIGDAIRTTLTPLTFSTPSFNGIQMDFAADKYQATALLSRISNPGTARRSDRDLPENSTDYTGLMGFRGTAQVGDFATVGATYVGSRNGTSLNDFVDNSFQGQLTTAQNAGKVRSITIRISDDSPEDGKAGGMLFEERILIDGREVDLGPGNPQVRGGTPRGGALVADGADQIFLRYDLSDYSYVDDAGDFRDLNRFERVGFLLVLANDYRIDVTSNVQTNASGQEIFLPMAQATGNIGDGTNQQAVEFDYGLPTGNEVFGFTLDVQDVGGLGLKGEWDRNRRHRRFPNSNPEIGEHFLATGSSEAYYLTASWLGHPWFAYGEVFSMDPGYTTRAYLTDAGGRVFYDDSRNAWFEFVDDNDDQDRYPDWRRNSLNQRLGNDIDNLEGVFPGLDENNDLVSDYNQNENLQPDYLEPFLQHSVDPPEYLFGLDMNNNTVIDRFENDDEADYPYRRDHRGYNAYVGVELVGDAKVTVGRLDERLISAARTNESLYGILTVEHDIPAVGVVRVFDHVRLVEDSIPEDLFQWIQTPGTLGGNERVVDPLVAPNTLINTAYVEFTYIGLPRWRIGTKVKHEVYHQRDEAPGLRRSATFLGVVNRLDYVMPLMQWNLRWRLKSQYKHHSPSALQQPRVHELAAMPSLLLDRQVLGAAHLTGGVEFTKLFDFEEPLAGRRGGNEFHAVVYALQLSNTSAYQGYSLTANVGFRSQTRYLPRDVVKTSNLAFVQVVAGIGDR